MPETPTTKERGERIDKFTFLLKAIWFIGPAVLGAFVAYGTAVRTDAAKENRLTVAETEIRSLKDRLAAAEAKAERDRDRYLTSEEFERWMKLQMRTLEESRGRLEKK